MGVIRENDSIIVMDTFEPNEETATNVVGHQTLRILLSFICIFGIIFNLMVFCKRTKST